MPRIEKLTVVFESGSYEPEVTIDSGGDMVFANEQFFTPEQVSLAQELVQVVLRENNQ